VRKRNEPRSESDDVAHALEVTSARERLRVLLEGPPTFDARFSIGCLAARLQAEPRTFGAGALARMAEFLGQDVTLLYRYANVATCWTEAEARQLISEGTRGEQALTWSHLVALAAIDGSRERAHWTKRARAESMSVRGLGALVARRRHDHGPDLRLERATRAAARFLARCETDVFESSEFLGCRDAMARALRVYENLYGLAARRLDALRSACAAEQASGAALAPGRATHSDGELRLRRCK
jgi:hypothetical protein